MKILVTGGAGYIGSTVCSALTDNGHTPVILDSLITGREEFTRNHIFYRGDISDKAVLERIFSEHPDISCAIHFAALIVVSESVEKPYDYYYNNVAKSLELFSNLNRLGCKNVVFSSSASIYDDVPGFMVTEQSPLNPRSPYARTKFMMEMVLRDFCQSYGMKGIALRYFNPIGADPAMRSGAHLKNASHILGKLVSVARGEEPAFAITGTQWDTRDGTGIRDYIHVWDLAMAHVKAVENLDRIFGSEETKGNTYMAINLGTGRGVTVKEMVTAFEKVLGREINKLEAPPRPGDVAGTYANADVAWRLLGWKAGLTLEQGIANALEWDERRKEILNYD